MKECRGCNEVKNLSEFYKRADNKNKVLNKCKKCIIKQQKEFYAKNPERQKQIQQKGYKKHKDKRREASRKWHENNPKAAKSNKLKKKYNISIEDYNTLLEKQNNTCAICQQENKHKRAFHVDHCHETGKIRGLLCHSCNTGIGSLKDNIELLRAAINYLEQ
jgi:hypothetical protein